MGVFVISPTDKGGHLHTPSARLLGLCEPLHPIVFNDLFCLSAPGIHTISVGAACPSDLDLHLEAVALLPRAAELLEPVLQRLETARREALGEEWLASWERGLPAWEDTPGGINLPVLLWLHNLLAAWDLEGYCRARYGLLGQAGGAPYPRLRQVLVYPGAFAAQAAQAAEGGVVQEQRQALSGQSWAHGQVVLGWAEVLAGAADPSDGQNVVVHEFAHQIDQDKGLADGRPWLPGRARRRRWAAVMDDAFWRLRAQPSTLIGAYAATAPAEFFAVTSELFFEQPQALAAAEPAVYRELALLYQVHPLAW
jgi:hypothetical protein